MRVGAAKIDITPELPVPLAGFAARNGALVDTVADPLHLRATVIESEDTKAAIVAADLLSWGPEIVARLRPQLAEKLDVPADLITFAATHTHSGPQTHRWHADSVGPLDPRYLDRLTERALDVAAQAAAALEPVTAHRASSEHDLGSYRRADQENADRDNELTTVAFRRADGSLVAAFVHYTCHPVINGSNAVTSDFPGIAGTTIEAGTGGIVSYLQGCCGDQNPQKYSGAGLDVARREGKRFAAAIAQTLAGDQAELAPIRLRTSWSTVELPFQSAPTDDELRAASEQPGVMGEWGRAYLAHPERRAPTATLHLQRLDLADGLSILTMNAEVCVAYGHAVRAASGNRCLPVAYANGIIGYLPTAAQIAAGGYEAVDSARYYLLAGLFAPEVEELTMAEIKRMLRST